MKISSFNGKIGQAIDWSAKKLSKELNKNFVDQAKFASNMLLISIVSKDAVNCALYTYQSYNNEKIPEDKRKFVAANDFINGFINVGGQIFAGWLINKTLIPKIIGKKFTGIQTKNGATQDVNTNAKLAKDNLYQITKNAIMDSGDYLKSRGINPEDVDIKDIAKKVIKLNGKGSSKYENIVKGMGIVITALGTTALVKRSITPLLSTPIASWVKNKYMSEKKEAEPIEDRVYHQWNSLGKDNAKKNKAYKNFI